MTTIYRVLAALPLALVLMLHTPGAATPAEEPCMLQVHGMFNPCADLDPVHIDDLR